MQVYKGIEMFPGIGNEPNIFLLDGEVLVDTGTGNTFAQLKEEIEHKFNKKQIKTIVNTHYHFDHTGGNKKFRDWLKADIAIHADDKEKIEQGETLAEMMSETTRIVTVDHGLYNGDIIKTSNFIFEVIHTPGHTQGSICLYESDKRILISGDTLFSDSVGRTDLAGGSMEMLISSLKKLSELPVMYLFPGHGSIRTSGIDFLIKQMLVAPKLNAMI